MRRFSALLAVLLLVSCAAPTPSLGTTCGFASLEQLIGWADVVFIGTVDAKSYLRVPGSIMTRYRFRDVRYVKGSGSLDSLILIQEGGILGNQSIGTVGEPSFEVGKRYVSPARLMQGYRGLSSFFEAPLCSFGYSVLPESGYSVPTIHWGEMRLVAFDGRHMVWVDRPYMPPGLGTPPRVRTLVYVIRMGDAADFARNAALRGSVPDSVLQRDQLQTLTVSPPEAQGVRVSEDQFIESFKMVVDRLSRRTAGVPR